MNEHVVLDLFAGTGVGVALRRMGAREHAVEINPDVHAVRALNSLGISYADVWDVERSLSLPHDTEWGSPPCPSFSSAGKGSGRRQMPVILQAVEDRIWEDIHRLREWSDTLEDPRSGLTLVNLHYAWRHRPQYIALEQVPAVLPIWQAYAEHLRGMGYSVWVGKLHAEQYGVPQTRTRAILMARRDGKESRPPRPTHSRYYPRDPGRLDEGVPRWISMAEALGWGMTERPMTTAASRSAQLERPAPTITGGGVASGGAEVFSAHSRDVVRRLRSAYGTNGDFRRRGERDSGQPAATVTSKAGLGIWEDRPSTTVAADDRIAGPGRSEFVRGGVSRQDRPGTVNVTVEEAATLQSYPADFRWDATAPHPRTGRVRPITKSARFLQIGNAVPPLLAEAILRELWS